MEQLLRILKSAVEMENNGYKIYMDASEKTSNKFGKQTLKAIADKELDHIAAINEFIAQLSAGTVDIGRAIANINPKDKKEYIAALVKDLRSELSATIVEDSDLEKAYRVAMSFEKGSYDLYKKLSEEINDPQSVKFFEFLMGEENTHYELLQETLEYLNNPGDWFKEQERWIVEG